MYSSDDYKREVMKDLASGNTEKLPDESSASNYENFDDFAQRSSRSERHQLFSRSFSPDQVPLSQMEPELQKAIAQIKPSERNDVARNFFSHLKEKGLKDQELERQLGLSSHNPNRMSSNDVSKLAGFAYHNYPDIFHEVLADQPALVKFLSNPLIGAIFGAVASKWLGARK